MKLIEALKQSKDLLRKAEDLRKKIAEHSAIASFQTPEYADQRKQVREWLQAHADILKEIQHLKVAIARTNLNTEVVIELGEKTVKRSISEWVIRRRDLAKLDQGAWAGLTDRRIQEGVVKTPSGDPMQVTLIRFYDPEERDKNVALYAEEPSLIDARLEIINAVTELVE